MSKLFPEVEELDASAPMSIDGQGISGTLSAVAAAVIEAAAASAANEVVAPAPSDDDGTPRIQTPSATPRILAMFDRFCGLPGRFRRGESECHVTALTLAELHRIEVTVEGGGVPKSSFFILEGSVPNALARTRHLSLLAHGRDVPNILQFLIKQVAYLLHEAPFAPLVKALVENIKAAEATIRKNEVVEAQPSSAPPADGLPLPHMAWPPTDVDEEYLNSLGFGYSPPGAWRNFLQGHENNYGGIENTRGYCQRMTGHVVNVNHTEIECFMSSPQHGNGTPAFWNHVAAVPFQHSDDESHLELFSDLTDMDVIKGGTHKLDRLLDALAENGRKADMVVMTSTCTTTVIGDDTVGSVERLKKKSSLRVLNMSESRDVREILFDEIRARPEFLTVAKRPGTINMVGLPKLDGYDGFLDLLRESGVEVNTWVLPEVSAAQLEHYMAGQLQVFYDWPFLDRSYKTLFGPVPLPSVRPPAPYGIAGTRQWLTEVAEGLGKPGIFDAAWDRRIATVQPRWDALVREARDYRLGFIGEEKTLLRFFETRQILGIPILPLLEEMGFGLDFYLNRPRGSSPAPSEVEVEGGRRTRYFNTPEELEEMLRESDTAAFYTELFFDRRITRSGKNSFSIKEFGRLGLEGSLESLRLLVASCRLPFFRTFGKYMGRPFAVGVPAELQGEADAD